ncbi:sulfatase [Luteolibacter algae]|uniref:Sulfatase n=1 Tax=Luteolibacter algae TaxID=454151 RepID=A0ABW5D6C2_9BACT
MKLLTTLAALLTALPAFAEKQPNILYIMSDDHAAHAIGAYGGRLSKLNPTPSIDRLAKEGALMENTFCTNSICSPSRATVITGQYSHTNGVRILGEPVLPENQTLPLEMKKAGYVTGMIGKWHLEVEPASFDYYSVLNGQGNYFNPVMNDKKAGKWPDNIVHYPTGKGSYDSLHTDDVITDLSIDWMKQQLKSGKPFFLMHHFKGPHDNFENAERYDFLYDDIEIPEPSDLYERSKNGPLDHEPYGTSVSGRNSRRNMGHHMFVDPNLEPREYTHVSYQRYLKKYLRTIRGVDDNIGRVLDFLEKEGELDNTLIIYTSDQGFMTGEHDMIDKRWMYEESLRMPFVARYPAAIKGGTKVDQLANNVDFAPTLLDFAGVKEMPESFEGRSFLPLLEGKTISDWPEATYYRYWMHMAHHDNPAHYGIRTKKYKLIYFYGLQLDTKGEKKAPTPAYWEFYDLSKDPQELNNAYADPEYAETIKKLKSDLLDLKEEIGDTDEKYPELMKVREETWE